MMISCVHATNARSALFPDDRPVPVQFREWLYQRTADELFVHNILWTDEACFTRGGVPDIHKSNLGTGQSSCYPQTWVSSPLQRQRLAGIVGDVVVSLICYLTG
jgi:hypothetical protein